MSSTMIVTVDDLDSLLALDGDIDRPRAQLLLDLATERCSVIVSPLPPAARGIVLSVAARAYLNPSGIVSETVGPTSIQFGASGVGIYLRDDEQSQLEDMSGRGGAFVVNLMPDGAGSMLPAWDRNEWGDQLPTSIVDELNDEI